MSTAPLISIVDDDASVRAGLGDFISSIGYSAHTFESAEDFLDSSILDSTRCVIADVCLEVMNGVQLQRLLRKQGHRVPFIFITAVADENMRRHALDDGAICFLIKPLDGDALIKCLNAAIDERGQP